ncbi:hypothetical protein [Synechococcus sp. PCC 6312]|uniref:hypothetical protein n=1 Tax=Synechococcus sp. (strain ATCC 27167 / PCC 6312) TaxID=195253 RepID=UPI00029F2AF2|nr:hypothetical protein [Synechococcus sp. PCC 6312]AFY61224.1 hypothetical protein Syn6312_2103 [Synechococcus sp. PCC 6312]
MAGQLPVLSRTARLTQPVVGNRKLLLLITVNTLIVFLGYFAYRTGLERAQHPAFRDAPNVTHPYQEFKP